MIWITPDAVRARNGLAVVQNNSAKEIENTEVFIRWVTIGRRRRSWSHIIRGRLFHDWKAERRGHWRYKRHVSVTIRQICHKNIAAREQWLSIKAQKLTAIVTKEKRMPYHARGRDVRGTKCHGIWRGGGNLDETARCTELDGWGTRVKSPWYSLNESARRSAPNTLNRSCHSKLHPFNDKIVIGRRRHCPPDRLVDSRNAACFPTDPAPDLMSITWPWTMDADHRGWG